MKVFQLEYFCAAARLHSTTKAAAELFVTQPAISNSIRELEKEFSITLFNRNKTPLSLTKEGELFYQKAIHLVGEYNQTVKQFFDISQTVSTVKIGIPPLLSTIFFPELFASFKKQYPDIPVELFEYGSIRAAKMVRDGFLDVALVNMHFYDIDKLNSLVLSEEKLVFCVSASHPLAQKQQITVEDIKNEPIIMYNTDSVQNSTLASVFKSTDVSPNVILHASQLFTIEKFISGGLGGAFLYESLLKNMNGVKGIPVVPALTQNIGLVWRKGSYTTGCTEKFIDFVTKNK